MIKLKNPRSLIYAQYQVCEIDPCEEEAAKIWASSESRIVELCEKHYKQLTSQGNIS